ncbi:MAG: hypothetical protein IJ651_09280 [Bacteroidales bacterium]|nr:hypothetical protein [Bacteroidales bacterium]
MKKIHFMFLSAALAVAAVSCEKNVVPSSAPVSSEPVEEVAKTGTMHVSIGTETKAGQNGLDEKEVHSLQVFVFNASTGKRETDKFVMGNSLLITAPVGTKHVWAVVNHTRFDDVRTESELKDIVCDLTDNYAYGSIYLVMAGKKDVTVTQEDLPVQIDVTRLVSRIALQNVTLNFADTYLKNCTFEIKEIYLKNVAGNTNLSLDKNGNGDWTLRDPDVWYNKMRDENTASVNPLISDHGLNITCAEGQQKQIDKVWYACPNPTSVDNNNPSWSARRTRLVVHAEVGGYGSSAIQSYYTFTLPVLKRNCSYEISNITFTMLGKENDNDDTVTDTGIASITLNVLNWDTPTPINYNM